MNDKDKKEFFSKTWLSRCIMGTLIEAGSGVVHTEEELNDLEFQWQWIESKKVEWEKEASNMACDHCGADLLCSKCESKNFKY